MSGNTEECGHDLVIVLHCSVDSTYENHIGELDEPYES